MVVIRLVFLVVLLFLCVFLSFLFVGFLVFLFDMVVFWGVDGGGCGVWCCSDVRYCVDVGVMCLVFE